MNEQDKTALEKADEARRAYHKAWRDRNRDRIRQYNKRYWEKKAQQSESEKGGPTH